MVFLSYVSPSQLLNLTVALGNLELYFLPRITSQIDSLLTKPWPKLCFWANKSQGKTHGLVEAKENKETHMP